MQHFLDPSLVSLETTTFTMMKRGRVPSGKQEKGRQKGKLYQKMTSAFQKRANFNMDDRLLREFCIILKRNAFCSEGAILTLP